MSFEHTCIPWNDDVTKYKYKVIFVYHLANLMILMTDSQTDSLFEQNNYTRAIKYKNNKIMVA